MPAKSAPFIRGHRAVEKQDQQSECGKGGAKTESRGGGDLGCGGAAFVPLLKSTAAGVPQCRPAPPHRSALTATCTRRARPPASRRVQSPLAGVLKWSAGPRIYGKMGWNENDGDGMPITTQGATGSQRDHLQRTNATTETVRSQTMVGTVCKGSARNDGLQASVAGARRAQRAEPHAREGGATRAFLKSEQCMLITFFAFHPFDNFLLPGKANGLSFIVKYHVCLAPNNNLSVY